MATNKELIESILKIDPNATTEGLLKVDLEALLKGLEEGQAAVNALSESQGTENALGNLNLLAPKTAEAPKTPEVPKAAHKTPEAPKANSTDSEAPKTKHFVSSVALTSKKGIIAAGQPIKAEYFNNGEEVIESLKKRGLIK